MDRYARPLYRFPTLRIPYQYNVAVGLTTVLWYGGLFFCSQQILLSHKAFDVSLNFIRSTFNRPCLVLSHRPPARCIILYLYNIVGLQIYGDYSVRNIRHWAPGGRARQAIQVLKQSSNVNRTRLCCTDYICTFVVFTASQSNDNS